MAEFPVDAGARDRKITIQSRSSTEPAVDSAGAPKDTWTTLCQPFARKQDLRGTEKKTGDQMTAAFDTLWNIPYRADMDPDLLDVPKLRRLVCQGRAYDIVTARQGERKASVYLMTLSSTAVAL